MDNNSVIVPKEITKEMQKAYFDVIDRNLDRVSTDARFGRHDSQREAYRAMLAAAPQSPENQSAESSNMVSDDVERIVLAVHKKNFPLYDENNSEHDNNFHEYFKQKTRIVVEQTIAAMPQQSELVEALQGVIRYLDAMAATEGNPDATADKMIADECRQALAQHTKQGE